MSCGRLRKRKVERLIYLHVLTVTSAVLINFTDRADADVRFTGSLQSPLLSSVLSLITRHSRSTADPKSTTWPTRSGKPLGPTCIQCTTLQRTWDNSPQQLVCHTNSSPWHGEALVTMHFRINTKVALWSTRGVPQRTTI